MGEAAHGDSAHGHMNIKEQRETFHAFIATTIWCSALTVMGVALLTLAFAIGAGWWAGLGAFVVIGVGIGFLFKQTGAWWAMLIGLAILGAIGGVIVPLIASLG